MSADERAPAPVTAPLAAPLSDGGAGERSGRVASAGLARLVVGFDGSAAAEHALDFAAALATAAGGELLIMLCDSAHALADISFDVALTDATNADGLAAAVAADLAGRFDGTGLRWTFERREEGAADALAAAAVEWDADAVVVGRSGARFPRSVLGSVAAHLTRHCERPVLVVP
jgi:nucleotide-binding universal stress UspA family protein